MDRIEKLVAERNKLAAEIDYVRACLDDDSLEQERFDEGVEFCARNVDALAEQDKLIDNLRHIKAVSLDERNVTPGTGPTVIVQRDNVDPFDVRDIGPMTTRADLKARALTAIEKVAHTDDRVREAATRTLETVSDRHGEVARRILLTGSDAYRSAFQKIANGDHSGFTLDDSERAAMARASSLTDTAGGFAIPFTLDSTVILTNNGAVNAIRDMARTVQITTDTWNGVSSAGVTASYDAEAAEVSDDAPTLAQPSITTRMARAFVPFSIEIGQDWPGMEEEIRREIVDAKDRLETTVFWSGVAASNQPIGVETAVTATAGSLYTTATAEVLASADIRGLYSATTPRSRASSSYGAIAEFSTLVEIRRLLAAGQDRSSYNEATAGQPATLFGWPIREHSSVDPFSGVNAAATATHYLMVTGDWSKYVIAERVGMSMELVPHLFHTTTNLPSGQRGFFASWRNGADSVDDNAFRVLVLVTSGA